MKILDTNLWVFGTLGTHAQAVDWLDAIEAGETTPAINAYMVQELLDAFDRTPGLSAAERDAFKTEFLTRLVRMAGLLEAPSSRDISESMLADRRSSTRIQLIARILDIQPKDVPIVVLAFEHSERKPTILTNDATFAALTPADHNLPNISITHVQ